MCRYDNKAARLPSVVKPGDLGLAFSDSSAKEFCIEIDRVKVPAAAMLSDTSCTIMETFKLDQSRRSYVTYKHAQPGRVLYGLLLCMYVTALQEQSEAALLRRQCQRVRKQTSSW